MTLSYDAVIIGAGSAGLSARSEVAKETDNYLVVDGGELGTTCARVGCMPSKALIHAARRWALARESGETPGAGGKGAGGEVMRHVRSLRDRFAGSVVDGMDKWRNRLRREKARFLDPTTLEVGGERITAARTIIAVGSKPVIPRAWQPYRDFLVDTEELFELESLPRRMAVIGLGPVGIELGHALARLGVEVTALTRDDAIGGLTDPAIREKAFKIFSERMTLRQGKAEITGEARGSVTVACGEEAWTVERVLAAVGRRPALTGLGLENLGVELDDSGLPPVDETTMQIPGVPVFIAGDANGRRPLLHEAADEGRIAGHNAVAADPDCFRKRCPLAIVFSDPDIALAGRTHAQLTGEGIDFATGSKDFAKQGRALLMGENEGRVNVYAGKEDGRLLGAELVAPAGEHLAHQLAWMVAAEMTAADVLAMPFYHPTLEEGLRSAFREAAKQSVAPKPKFEMERCRDFLIE